MKSVKTSNPYEAAQYAYKFLKDETHEGGRIFLLSDSVAVCTGQTDTCDLSYCEAHGIMTFKALHVWGTIVVFPGDLSIMDISWGRSDYIHNIMGAVADWLKDRDLNVEVDHNDILIDGKKCASWAVGANIDGWVQSVAHFSVGTQVDLIRDICKKPMTKVPGALSDYEITAEDLLDVIERS